MSRKLIIAFILLTKVASAQVLGISLVPGSCAKCMMPVSELSPKKTGIPSFIVLPQSMESDSASFEESYEFSKMGYTVLFSDKYWNLLHHHPEGTMGVISESGKILLQESLVSPNVNTLPGFLALLKNLKFSSGEYSVSNIDRDVEYEMSFTTARFTKRDTGRNYIYTMPPDFLASMHKYYLTHSGKPRIFNIDVKDFGPQFKPAITGINRDPHPPRVTTIVKDYVAVPFGADTGIATFINLVEWKNNHPVSYKLIADPPAQLRITFISDYYVLDGRGNMYMVCMPSGDSVNKFIGRRFIGVWSLTDGIFVFKKLLPAVIPADHPYNGHRRLSMLNASYPYIITTESKYLINFITADEKPLPVPEKLKSLNQPLYYSNISVENNRLYVIYKRGNYVFLQSINLDTFMPVATIELSGKIFNIEKSRHISVSANENILYASQANGQIRGFPLDFFISE